MNNFTRLVTAAAVVLTLAVPSLGFAQATSAAAKAGEQAGGSADLAKQLSNPISSLISVPFQYNYNRGLGAGDGKQSYINIQPVIPFSISDNWNVISRTIIPVVSMSDLTPTYGTQYGLGNIVQSFFFSPKAPTKAGLIWGVGPVIQFPTATNGMGPNQWGAGLTAVGLVQKNGWTVGGLVNHVWSLNKNDTLGKTSNTFLQPFVSYSTKKATSFTLNAESTYDWENDTWSVPINFMVAQVIKIDKRPVQISGGVRYWAESPAGGADKWGARLQVTYLFPK